MEKIKIDPIKGARGIEAYYYPEQKWLHIGPTNCRFDWVTNVLGWILGLGMINLVWFIEVLLLMRKIKDLDIKSLTGYSKGGAQAVYLWLLFLRDKNCEAPTLFAAFPPYWFAMIPGTLVKNAWDLVPLFSRWRYALGCEVIRDKENNTIAKRHWWSLEDIEKYQGE